MLLLIIVLINQVKNRWNIVITSAQQSKERFSAAVREHWGIENSLYWVLDATMNEVDCQIYGGNATEIMAYMRHMALNMLCAEGSKKASIRCKQKIAAMSSSYQEKVFLAGFNAVDEK